MTRYYGSHRKLIWGWDGIHLFPVRLLQGSGRSLGFQIYGEASFTPHLEWAQSFVFCPLSPCEGLKSTGFVKCPQGERWYLTNFSRFRPLNIPSFLARKHLKCCFLNITSSILVDFIWGSGKLPSCGTGKSRCSSLRLLTSWGPNGRHVPFLSIVQRHEQISSLKRRSRDTRSHEEDGIWGRPQQTSISGGSWGCMPGEGGGTQTVDSASLSVARDPGGWDASDSTPTTQNMGRARAATRVSSRPWRACAFLCPRLSRTVSPILGRRLLHLQSPASHSQASAGPPKASRISQPWRTGAAENPSAGESCRDVMAHSCLTPVPARVGF